MHKKKIIVWNVVFAASILFVGAVSFLGLFTFAETAQATSVETYSGIQVSSLTITGTKTVLPISEIQANQELTYTIVFTTDSYQPIVVISDTFSEYTDFAGIITGTPSISISKVAQFDHTVVWTVTDVATNSTVMLTLTVQINDSLRHSAAITNQARISGTTVVATNLVTSNAVITSYAYLPIIQKNYQPPALLYIQSENTGTISSVEIRKSSDNSLVTSCSNVTNNTRVQCGNPFIPGTYRLRAQTSVCGLLQTNWTFYSGSQTVTVYCD